MMPSTDSLKNAIHSKSNQLSLSQILRQPETLRQYEARMAQRVKLLHYIFKSEKTPQKQPPAYLPLHSFNIQPKSLLTRTPVQQHRRVKVDLTGVSYSATNIMEEASTPQMKAKLPERQRKKVPVLASPVPKPTFKANPIVGSLRRINTQQSQLPKVPVDLSRVSAHAWAIYDCTSQRTLYHHNGNIPLEIASLTKIATVLAAYTIDLDIDREVRVSAKAVRRQGTSAGLIEGELITLRNLAYAIMLPSGNDAAQALVEQICEKPEFYRRMNQLAGLTTNFCSCDGLPNEQNKSSAVDVALLCARLLQHDFLRKVVATKHHKCGEHEWTNTNKLIGYAHEVTFTGVKTGTTASAGPCLAVSLRLPRSTKEYVIVVLKSYTSKHRYKDVLLLTQHLLSNL